MQSILLIYGSLNMGGIETLIVRMSKAFAERGISVSLLLQSRAGNVELIRELNGFAKIIYLDELVKVKLTYLEKASFLNWFLPLSSRKVKLLLSDIEHVHVFESLGLVAFARLIGISKTRHRVSVGVYHQFEYIYSKFKQKYFVDVIKKKFSKICTEKNVIFFNEISKVTLAKETGLDFSESPLLPIGIDIPKIEEGKVRSADRLKVVSVGRLTNFKTYNFHFLKTLEQLREEKIFLKYHIYGTGDDESKLVAEVRRRDLSEQVTLHGALDYSNFQQVVSDAFLFVGSGTALIEAAAYGVPALIGIESQPDDQTYGFLHETTGQSYHEAGLPFEKHEFKFFYDKLSRLSYEEYLDVCSKSSCRAKEFSIQIFVDKFIDVNQNLKPSEFDEMQINRMAFVGSVVFDKLIRHFRPELCFWNRHHQH